MSHRSVVRDPIPRHPLVSKLADDLTAEIGRYFSLITSSLMRPLIDLDPAVASGTVFVIYSGSGMPVYAGSIGRDLSEVHRQRLDREIQSIAERVPMATCRTIEVGDDRIAGALARLFVDLFGGFMPFMYPAQHVWYR